MDRPDFPVQMAAAIPMQGITAITGPSGAGKTTLLRAIAGLDPAHGPILLDGVPLDNVPSHKRGIGFVFQDPRLFPHLNVAENVAYGARRRGGLDGLDAIVAAMDIGPLMARRTGGLSGGEARRVALARALASHPQLLLLDEPMSGLDTARKAEILPYLVRAIHQFGIPALYVSHARDETLMLADRILRIDGGRVAGWADAPARLRATTTLTGRVRGLRIAGVDTIAQVPNVHRHWQVAIDPDDALLSQHNPGPGTGIATLQAVIAHVSTHYVDIRIAEDSVRWPHPDRTGWQPRQGETCYLTLLKVHPRPDFTRSE